MTAPAFEVPSIYDLCGASRPATIGDPALSGVKPKNGISLSSFVLMGSIVLAVGGICWYMYKQEQTLRKQLYNQYKRGNENS